MDTIHESGAPPAGMTEDERQHIREQLNRMLETHHFKNSKRYPPLLRFIVEETLEGRGEFLKERLLGVRVFDRPADYDTAADPIVRVTIAEIRKRIAQYYHDEEHDSEIRIELQPGRYAPEFRTRHGSGAGRSPSAAEMAELSRMGVPAATAMRLPDPEPALVSGVRSKSLRWYQLTVGLLVAALLALTAMPILRWLQPSALNTFWSPLLSSPKPILFCIPTDVGKKRGPAGSSDGENTDSGRRIKASGPDGPTFLEFESLGQNVVFSDTLAVLGIGSVFAVNHHDYLVKLNVYSNLEDLRQGPAVLIGGLDNQWTMRALAPLRYHFAGSDEDRYWIADAQDPNNKRWSLDLKMQWGAVTRDYAIVARLHNEETGQPEMIVAGIGMSGTAAAGEFITKEDSLKELRQRLGPGFKDRDFEAVLSTDVVNGIAGSPRILAASTW